MTRNDHHDDASMTAESRASQLLSRMTLREKCFQLVSVPPWYLVTADGSPSSSAEEYNEQAPGHICNFGVDDPITMSRIVGGLQHAAVDGTRLGIPLLIHAEALNGFLAGGHMVFPTPTGLAATWSPELVEAMSDIIRRQMKRVGVRHALSPNMDIAIDPRWGRMHETYGEDPYLAAAFSVAYTRGLQSADLGNGVIATAKHFIGYGLPEGGINLSAYEGGTRRTRDLFAYPFEAAIQLAGLGSVMNSYADVDGVPAAASWPVLTELLRDTLGFDGFVSSDYTTLQHMVTRQQAADGPAEAGRLAIHAGLDTEFPTPYGYGDTLAEEVAAGRVDISDVDTSVHRILTAKYRLGLFENPYPAESIDLAAVASEGRDLSRELARRAIVLAKNDGLLPLAVESTIAVIGPHADAVTYQFPTYSYPAFRDMTVFMSSGGMGNMVGIDPGMVAWNNSVFPPVPVEEYVRDRLGATSLADEIAVRTPAVLVERGSTLTSTLDEDALSRAVEVAARADVVILALGGGSLWFNGERTEGEASDSADISLPLAQQHLAEAVATTGTPIVAVLVQGRPYVLPRAVRDAAAIVIAPYGGPFGPAGVVDVLFGTAEPTGKLPYSIPRHTGQIPVYHHQHAGTGYRNPLPPDVDRHYLDLEATPLYTFGHGLSYTEFAITDPASDSEFATDGAARITFTLTNVGERAGATVAQLYVRASSSGVTRPAQQLAGFGRVELAAGESRRMSFTLDASQLGYTNLAGEFTVDPGVIEWHVGLDADHQAAAGTLRLTGESRPLRSADRTFLSEVVISDV
ncbi:glycoside hydrolase family 3 N-terminal domain-containing protein [Microbacterium aurantiacum]|uniref:glycoside hydrolase family 3 N-terminal domain-containing protein n=1 Tax=Microbacterium aurantiacum TaxID=162393 RepID=UPI000C7FC946|nr:glycoside hydrolase family 3 N-terminal domain-containing protein [Microbacterium aurantiacum]